MNLGKINCRTSIQFIIKVVMIAAISIVLPNAGNAQESKTGSAHKKQDCFARLGMIESRNVSKNELKVQEGIIAYVKITPSHLEPTVVENFLFMIIRDTSIVFQYKNTGPKFETVVKSALQNLQKHDLVLIFSFYARLANSKNIFLNPLEFKAE